MILGAGVAVRRAGTRTTLASVARPVIGWLHARIVWLTLCGSFVLTAILYGNALGFAFLFDDTYDLTRTEGRSYWSLLSSSQGYSYYRPLPFLIWKLARTLQGHYDQPALHALPLVAHAMAGWLLFLLLRRLGYGAWAVLPAILFLTNPFSYQATAIAGTLFHPLAGAAILGSLVLYLYAREHPPGGRRVALHLAALGTTALAVWTHESGVAVAPLLSALEGLLLWRARSRRPSPWLVGHLVLTALFVLTWFVVEKAPSTEHTTIGELRPKSLYLLQGFTYPFSAQVVWLDVHLGHAPGILETGMLALAFVFGAYAVAGRRAGRRRWRLLLSLSVPALAVASAVAAFAPALARLSYSYVEDSPRLLYLVGVGSATFWGLLPALDFRNRPITRTWRIGTLLMLVLVVIQSWRFIDVRLTMFERGSAVVAGIVEQGERFNGQQVLVINAPSWFAQNRYEYVYGHYGVQLMPSYIGLDRVIYASSHHAAHVDAVSSSWYPDVSGGVYPFGPHGSETTAEQLDGALREGREALVVRPGDTAFSVTDAGRLVPDGAETRPDAPGIIAGAVRLSPARWRLAGTELVVFIRWHVSRSITGDAHAIIELRAGDGSVVGRYDNYPLSGLSLPELWRAGDRIDDTVTFERPESGTYTILAGLQHTGDGSPYPAMDGGSGVVLPDGMVPIGEVTVP